MSVKYFSFLLLFAGALLVMAEDTLKYEVRDAYGQFAYEYREPEGTIVQQQGILKSTADGTRDFVAFKGRYKYLSPEGVPVDVSYTADENGFQPISDNIPKPVQYGL